MTDPREIEQLVEAVRGALLDLPNATPGEAANWNAQPLLDLTRLAAIAKTAGEEADDLAASLGRMRTRAKTAEERVRELEDEDGVAVWEATSTKQRELRETAEAALATARERAEARKQELWTRLLDMEGKYVDAHDRAERLEEALREYLDHVEGCARGHSHTACPPLSRAMCMYHARARAVLTPQPDEEGA